MFKFANQRLNYRDIKQLNSAILNLFQAVFANLALHLLMALNLTKSPETLILNQ
jgi:hypothetical protein